MEGSFPGTSEFALDPQGQVTKVDFRIDYSFPGGILGKIANQVLLERMNRNNIESMAEKLKILCEA